MRQRAAASLLYQSQHAEPAFRNLQKLIFLKIVGRILAFYRVSLISMVSAHCLAMSTLCENSSDWITSVALLKVASASFTFSWSADSLAIQLMQFWRMLAVSFNFFNSSSMLWSSSSLAFLISSGRMVMSACFCSSTSSFFFAIEYWLKISAPIFL